MMTPRVKGLKPLEVSSGYSIHVLKDVAIPLRIPLKRDSKSGIAPTFGSGNTKPHKHTRALAHYFNVVRTKA